MSDTEAATRAVLTTDGRVLVEQPDGSFRATRGETDWSKVDAITEDELAAAVASDPDDPGNDADFWTQARQIHPPQRCEVTIVLDQDVLDWFGRTDPHYRQRMGAVLRAYMESHRSEPG